MVALSEWAVARQVPLTTEIPLSFPQSSRILDFGCGSGWWLEAMRGEGYTELAGWDLDNPSLDRLASRGIKVWREEAERLPDSHFDCIRLEHVLEHVPEPLGLLKTLSQKLKPGGRLVLAVPNYGSWSAQVTGPGWDYLTLPYHENQFTPKSLRTILERAGLSVGTLKTLPIWEVAAKAITSRSSAPAKLARSAYFVWSTFKDNGDVVTAEAIRL
ncbi:MAG: class I SAM-dependent methyltransferase [Myxococcales bacterium]|nr:class I SAM-dependent methyltransferase [Myxococcales bacterium]